MKEYLEIKFYLNLKKIDERLVSSIINACIFAGSRYDENYVSFTAPRKKNPPLKEAINDIISNEGTIRLEHDGLHRYMLAFNNQNINKQKLSNVWLYISDSVFKSEIKGSNNAEEIIKITKSLWNSIYNRQIYGYGDNENYIPFPMVGPSTEEDLHPNDDDIIALDIPINKFWLNFYGKDMIEKYGEEALIEKEKGYRIERLDGGLLVITDVVPTSYKSSWN